ncbi:alkylphosphonate utilization protein [Glaciecola sp. XM2]|jgi:protein PhnA|uniref:zinc ribbon domain-containing protein YjdM n=1 Tax=Glaciecola sp. XM2 TaxID=1914931 RepID=UPI001BDE6ECB|nr:zinc ribbon domain-containing protein YjdM [Glaciecola sp. XM2]MBT1452240.1 alkylphosphonate utilization protein [Glaciecola sp. XM2]
MSNLPPCPQCKADYTYEDQTLLICPQCGHEWQQSDLEPQRLSLKDAVGNLIYEGDSVTLVKDLKVKGSSQVLKIGTKAKINRIVEGDHDIDCKVDGAGVMMLKSKVVKLQKQ